MNVKGRARKGKGEVRGRMGEMKGNGWGEEGKRGEGWEPGPPQL